MRQIENDIMSLEAQREQQAAEVAITAAKLEDERNILQPDPRRFAKAAEMIGVELCCRSSTGTSNREPACQRASPKERFAKASRMFDATADNQAPDPRTSR